MHHGAAGFEQQNGGAGGIRLDERNRIDEIANRVGIVGIAAIPIPGVLLAALALIAGVLILFGR